MGDKLGLRVRTRVRACLDECPDGLYGVGAIGGTVGVEGESDGWRDGVLWSEYGYGAECD